jgi:choline kinase
MRHVTRASTLETRFLGVEELKAIILAAGSGKRLRPLTDSTPKALIEIGGRTLIEHSLANLGQCGVREAIIVIGHLGHVIRTRIGNSCLGLEICYVENPMFRESGSMYSLWLTRGQLDSDVVFMDADILYNRKILEVLLESEWMDCLSVGKLSQDSGEEVKVFVKDGLVRNIGKMAVSELECMGEYIGIVKLSESGIDLLLKRAEQYFVAHDKNLEYEDCMQMLCDVHDLHYEFFGDLSWTEIDVSADIERAKVKIYPKILKEERVSLERSQGGRVQKCV